MTKPPEMPTTFFLQIDYCFWRLPCSIVHLVTVLGTFRHGHPLTCNMHFFGRTLTLPSHRESHVVVLHQIPDPEPVAEIYALFSPRNANLIPVFRLQGEQVCPAGLGMLSATRKLNSIRPPLTPAFSSHICPMMASYRTESGVCHLAAAAAAAALAPGTESVHSRNTVTPQPYHSLHKL